MIEIIINGKKLNDEEVRVLRVIILTTYLNHTDAKIKQALANIVGLIRAGK